MTGAPVPEGAEAVVMVENSRPADDGRVVLDDPGFQPGQNVMPKGARAVARPERPFTGPCDRSLGNRVDGHRRLRPPGGHSSPAGRHTVDRKRGGPVRPDAPVPNQIRNSQRLHDRGPLPETRGRSRSTSASPETTRAELAEKVGEGDGARRAGAQRRRLRGNQGLRAGNPGGTRRRQRVFTRSRSSRASRSGSEPTNGAWCSDCPAIR